jgi:hypothetical protein
MAVNQEDKGFQQFDAELCLLGLHIRCQQPAAFKMPTWQHFLGVLATKVCPMEEILFAILVEIQTLLEQTNFSFQTYTKSTICIF